MILSEPRSGEFIMCSELCERFIVFLCGEDQRGRGYIHSNGYDRCGAGSGLRQEKDRCVNCSGPCYNQLNYIRPLRSRLMRFWLSIS